MISRRPCFREPIAEIFEAACLLEQAVEAHLGGSSAKADILIRKANMTEIWDWSDSIWGKTNPDSHRFERLPDSPPYLGSEVRPKPRMPDAATKKQIIERDGYHCRFCGIPVIPPDVRQKIRVCYPTALLWERNNVGQHAAFQCMWLQYDHLLPNQRGGDSSLDNVIITCAPCNFGRMMWTIEEAGLTNPLERANVSTWSGFDRWRGLTEFRV